MGKSVFHSHRYVTKEWAGLILPTPTAEWSASLEQLCRKVMVTPLLLCLFLERLVRSLVYLPQIRCWTDTLPEKLLMMSRAVMNTRFWKPYNDVGISSDFVCSIERILREMLSTRDGWRWESLLLLQLVEAGAWLGDDRASQLPSLADTSTRIVFQLDSFPAY